MESIYFYNPSCSITSGSIPANATIYGYSGSTAETYADNNGLLFMEIDGHEHHYSVTRTVAPTCTEDGYNDLFCPCGDRTSEVIPATGHTEVIVPALPATCTEGGYEEWSYCAVCGETITAKVTTPANGHTPAVTGAVAATCGTAGFTGVTYCTVCNDVLDLGETIPATGVHTPGEAIVSVISSPTCTSAGEKKITVKCAVCGNTLSEVTEDIGALGHSYTVEIIAPTCTQNGYTTYTCERGDSQYVDEFTDPLGHIDADGNGRCDRCNAETQSGSGQQGGSQQSGSIFDRIIQFFKRIADFFKNLFS